MTNPELGATKPEPRRRTFILGAGFSVAISKHMPLTDKLGDLVIERLRHQGVPFHNRPTYQGRGFEAWLSRLAEPQPDLDTAANHHNQLLFHHVTQALHQQVVASQNLAFEQPPPWWLQRLVGIMHFTDTTVVSFNYDTLVEQTVEYIWQCDERLNRVNPGDVVRHMPRLAKPIVGGLSLGNQVAETFRFIKLHGSIDTYWVQGDQTGATMARWSTGATYGRPVDPSADARNQTLPGREPFLVPPAAAKSAFYRNPLTTQLWQDAARALRGSTEIALLGYSIPPTDLVTTGMLGENLANRSTRVAIVNPSPQQPHEALNSIGIVDSRIREVASIEAYVDELDREVLPGLDWPHTSHHPVGVGQRDAIQFPIVKLVPGAEEDEVVAVVGPHRQTLDIPDGSPTMADLRGSENLIRRVRVLYEDGRSAYVARFRRQRGPSGAPEAGVLVPSAFPRA